MKLQGDFNYAECNYQNWRLSRTLGLRPYLLQKMPQNFQHPSPHFLCVTHWAPTYTLKEASPVWIVKNNAEEKLVFLTDQSFLFAHNAKGFVLEREMKSFWVCDSVQSHLTRVCGVSHLTIDLWCEPWAAERAAWLCRLNLVISTLSHKWTIS